MATLLRNNIVTISRILRDPRDNRFSSGTAIAVASCHPASYRIILRAFLRSPTPSSVRLGKKITENRAITCGSRGTYDQFVKPTRCGASPATAGRRPRKPSP